jgi:hypothetical protein
VTLLEPPSKESYEKKLDFERSKITEWLLSWSAACLSTDLFTLKPLRVALLLSPALVAVLLLPQQAYPFFS